MDAFEIFKEGVNACGETDLVLKMQNDFSTTSMTVPSTSSTAFSTPSAQSENVFIPEVGDLTRLLCGVKHEGVIRWAVNF